MKWYIYTEDRGWHWVDRPESAGPKCHHCGVRFINYLGDICPDCHGEILPKCVREAME